MGEEHLWSRVIVNKHMVGKVAGLKGCRFIWSEFVEEYWEEV